jgi:hypothetical protein
VLEKVIEQYLVAQVRKEGGDCIKWSSPSSRGVPDRIILLPNAVWFIEVKSPTGSLSPLQLLFQQKALQYNLNYAIISSKSQVDHWLQYATKST